MLSVQMFGPGGTMIGIPLPNILDRWASHTGRCGGATAEKAVPFPSDCPFPNSLLFRCARHSVAMASPSLPEVKRAKPPAIVLQSVRFCSARQIFSLSHIAERISCSAVTKLQRESGGGHDKQISPE